METVLAQKYLVRNIIADLIDFYDISCYHKFHIEQQQRFFLFWAAKLKWRMYNYFVHFFFFSILCTLFM